MPAAMRFSNQRNVAMNLKEGSGFRSGQGIIWNELAAKSDRMAVHSATGAMADLFEGQKDRLGEYLKAFRLVDCQVGAVFAINGEIAGLECFYHQQTFAKFFPKLVQSCALDAIDWPQGSKETQSKVESVTQFLRRIRKAPVESYASLGLGENLRFQDSFVSGAALVHEGKALHLSAFNHSGHKNDGIKVPLQRFSQRRRRS
jgi:hypothetical protein